MVPVSSPVYTLDELIRLALTEVRLQNQFFTPGTPEQETRLIDARRQYTDARQEIIMKTPSIWVKREVTLPRDVNLEEGWYRLPANAISLEDPEQIIDTGLDEHGTLIYKLNSPTIRYYAHTQEEARDPLFQRAVRYRFLSKLSTSEDSVAIYQSAILLKEAESYREWAASVTLQKDRIRSKIRAPFRSNFNRMAV